MIIPSFTSCDGCAFGALRPKKNPMRLNTASDDMMMLSVITAAMFSRTNRPDDGLFMNFPAPLQARRGEEDRYLYTVPQIRLKFQRASVFFS